MILILGNSSDSLIYLKNMLRYSEEKKDEGSLTSFVGKIYGQDVVLAETGYSSYRSGLISSYLIEKYHPYIVIYLGDAMKITNGLNVGDIMMGTFVQIIDINELNKDPSSRLYQVPGFPDQIAISDNLVKLYHECSAHVDVLNGKTGYVLSSNNWPAQEKDLGFDIQSFEAEHHSELSYEGEVGGIALSCSFYSVPLFPIFSICSDLYKPGSDLERKRIVLKNAVDIGKTVVSFIVSISSDEKLYIRSDFGADAKKMRGGSNPK
jgi:adenosylhomocysteine nucleosidase